MACRKWRRQKYKLENIDKKNCRIITNIYKQKSSSLKPTETKNQ